MPRVLAMLFFATRLLAQTATTDADSARIVAADLPRFWAAFDARSNLGAAKAIDSLYLRPGTIGLRDFARMRIGDSRVLGAAIVRDSTFYREVREATLAVVAESSAVRGSFRRLREIYPAAEFPDVYLLIGRRSAAGTVSNAGVLIGVEKLASGENGLSVPLTSAVITHEVVHYQQRIVGRTLLAMALREGGADFVAQLASGAELNRTAHEWLRAHESEVWAEFQTSMTMVADDTWFGTPPKAGWPLDLAYAVGYRIAQRYYERASDKQAAVRDMLVVPDAAAFLRRSGYAAPVPVEGPVLFHRSGIAFLSHVSWSPDEADLAPQVVGVSATPRPRPPGPESHAAQAGRSEPRDTREPR